jgi:hypothetical protein
MYIIKPVERMLGVLECGVPHSREKRRHRFRKGRRRGDGVRTRSMLASLQDASIGKSELAELQAEVAPQVPQYKTNLAPRQGRRN